MQCSSLVSGKKIIIIGLLLVSKDLSEALPLGEWGEVPKMTWADH